MRLLALLLALTVLAVGLRAADAPLKWGGHCLKQPAAWYATPEARALADTVLLYQSPEGGWPKNTDLSVAPTPEIWAKIEKEHHQNTIDNDATVLPLRYLARMLTAAPGETYLASFNRGLDYLLAAQYPNGGFPQYYPLRRTYSTHITYNDDAMVNVLVFLRDIARAKPAYAFVDPERRARAADAVARGIDCILKTQVRQNGRLTAWCAQHDENTLAPAWARKFEPPSLSGAETVGILRFLMAEEKPTPEIIASVEAAAAWLRSVALSGRRIERITNPDGRLERRLIDDPAAPPLWARFYELGTDRPLYVDRDSVYHYDFHEIGYERRSGYEYHGTWPAPFLAKDYPKWRARLNLPPETEPLQTPQPPAPAEPPAETPKP